MPNLAEAFDAVLDIRHLQRDYYPRIDRRDRVRGFLAFLWEQIAWGDDVDTLISDDDVNTLMNYVAMEVADRVDPPTQVWATAYIECDCGCGMWLEESYICGECRRSTHHGCCECIRCPHCGDVVDSYCTDCDRCEDCGCECTHCPHCGDRVDSYCSDCDRCEDCGCDCSRGLEERREGRPWFATALIDRKGFRSSRTCGVEWEFNGTNGDADPIMDWAARWRGGIHTDGSCGWEAVTAPMAGDYIAKILGDLGDAFEDAEATANDSCGLHVHVDARDLMWGDLEKLLRIFAHIEPVMFAIGGQNRQRNDYCAPSARVFTDALTCADRKGAILSLVESGGYVSPSRGREVGKGRISKKASGRYRSLNICPWLARMRAGKDRVPDCTVEFRLHRNTLDAKRVIGWTQLCVQIVDFAARASASEVDALCKLSALRALARIAPHSKEWIVSRIRAWRKDTSQRRGIARTVAVRQGKWRLTGTY